MSLEERYYKDIVIVEPIFILGYPRSATTGLHETIVRSSTNTFGLTMFHLMCPSNVLISISKIIFRLQAAKNDSDHHRITPDHLCEEQFLVPRYFLMLLFPEILLCLSEKEIDKIYTLNDEDMIHIKRIIQRKYQLGKQFIGKPLGLIKQVSLLKKHFPDCKIILCERNVKDSWKSFTNLIYYASVNSTNLTLEVYQALLNLFFKQYFAKVNFHDFHPDLIMKFEDWVQNYENQVHLIKDKFHIVLKEKIEFYRETKRNGIPEAFDAIGQSFLKKFD